jgi:uncharacterized membrane protein YeaQ/YmgE (transglycosylase-associated protein family)
MDFVWFLLIGLVAGWLASQIMKGPDLNVVGNMVLGVVGAVIGGFLFRLIGLQATGTIGSLVTATAGAMALIWAVDYFKKRR